MNTDLVEQVAQLLYKRDNVMSIDWEEISKTWKETYRDDARAVIEEIADAIKKEAELSKHAVDKHMAGWWKAAAWLTSQI